MSHVWCNGVYFGFSAPTELYNVLGREQKIKKYHEVVNRAITCAISRPITRRHTPRMGTFTSVARVLHNTHRTWRVKEELEWWMTKENLVTSSSSDDDEEGSGDE